MGLLEPVFSIYFVLLLIRAVIPDTGQMTFNQPYRLVIKITRPVVDFLSRVFSRQNITPAPVLGMLLIIFLQGLLYMGRSGSGTGVFFLGLSRWNFATTMPFWGMGQSIVYYLILLYRLYAFLLIIALISPLESASDQVSRLAKRIIQPVENVGRGRWPSLFILFISFTFLLTGLWKIYQVIGWLEPERLIPVKAGLDGIAIIIPLSWVIVFLIILRVVFSWFTRTRSSGGPLTWLGLFTEPFLRPFRRLNLAIGTIDLTPLVAILAVVIAGRVLSVIIGSAYFALPGA
ncbi:MAG: YggT family protein [Candidatus Euphemobacter frigidus]|nr:YggT family protein [Candidatus Euphemobacter frigidus]MDP8275286.1 YggT family protein [Candidatus Euphemobacter frigidus]